MIFTLRCQECKKNSYHLPEQFYSVWMEALSQVTEGDNHELVERGFLFSMTLNCKCGQINDFNSPMYQYAFKVIFDEFSSK